MNEFEEFEAVNRGVEFAAKVLLDIAVSGYQGKPFAGQYMQECVDQILFLKDQVKQQKRTIDSQKTDYGKLLAQRDDLLNVKHLAESAICENNCTVEI